MSLIERKLEISRLTSIAVGFAAALLTTANVAQASLPRSFAYQGHLTDASGNPVSGTISVKFQILAPNNCLLYEEQQNALDLSASNGRFTLAVGSAPMAAKRTINDPGLAMTSIFANLPAQLRASGANCATGYTPSAGDVRKLKVIIIDGFGEDPLTPDQVIHSVPFATTAETLQGKQPGDFILNSVGGMQSILEQIVNGTSNLYLRTDGMNATSVSMNNQRMTSVAEPTSAQDAATKNYCDTKIAGQTVMTGGLTNGSFLVWSTTNSRWEPGNLTSAGVQPHALATNTACTTSQASRWDGTSWTCVSTSGGGGGGGGATTNTNPQEVVTLVNGSTKVHQANFSGGGAYILPPANGGLTAGGPLFTFFNKNQMHTLPILNADGNYIGGVFPNGATNVFLFDTSTSGGQWSTDNMNSLHGVEKIVVDTAGPVNISNFSWAPLTATKILMVYSLPNTPPTWDVFARVADINTTAKTVTWGTPLLLDTGVSNGYGDLRVVSSTLAVVEYNSGSVQKALSISGASVSQSSPLSFSCSGTRAKLESDKLICLNASNGSVNVSIHTFGPTSVTSIYGSPTGFGSSHPQLGLASMLNGRLLLPYYRNDAPAGHYVAAVDTSDWSNQHLQLLVDNSYGMAGAPGTHLTSYVPVDATSTWYIPYTYMYSNLKKAFKINWDGTTLTSPSSVDTNGVQVFESGGTYYLETNSGTTPTRQRVNNPATLGLDPAVRSYYSHPRYAPNRGYTLTTSSADGGRLALHFEIGF